MTKKEVIHKILAKIDRVDKVDTVLDSPQTEFEDGQLVSLDLSDLGLTTLPKDLFNDIPQLKRFHASFNDIEELPENIFEPLNGLEFINLYGNNLTSLPEDIFEGMETIEWLDLRSNGLEVLPKSLGYLDNINYLFLQNNPLSEHPEHQWAADYHSRRDIKKFLPEFQEEMGLEVTMEKPLTREERAARALKRRQEREKKQKAKKEEDDEEEEEEEEESNEDEEEEDEE